MTEHTKRYADGHQKLSRSHLGRRRRPPPQPSAKARARRARWKFVDRVIERVRHGIEAQRAQAEAPAEPAAAGQP